MKLNWNGYGKKIYVGKSGPIEMTWQKDGDFTHYKLVRIGPEQIRILLWFSIDKFGNVFPTKRRNYAP